MDKYLMCCYGAAKVIEEAPRAAVCVGTVKVGENERYRVLKATDGLYAVASDWNG